MKGEGQQRIEGQTDIDELRAQILEYKRIVGEYDRLTKSQIEIINHLCTIIEELGGDVPENISELLRNHDGIEN